MKKNTVGRKRPYTGSTPVVGTTIIRGNAQSSKSAQSLHSISTKTASPTRKMKFPITVTYRQLEAKIYRSQIRGVKYYKAAYRAKGGRVTKTFKNIKETLGFIS